MTLAKQDFWSDGAVQTDDRDGWRAVERGAVVHIGQVGQSQDELMSGSGVTAERVESEAAVGETRWRADSRVYVRRPIVRPPSRPTRRTFIQTSTWEGSVIEVFATYFSAELIQFGTDETAYAEFEMSDVAPSDRELCEPGGLFYWAVGYETRESGQRSRESVITFRRAGRGASD